MAKSNSYQLRRAGFLTVKDSPALTAPIETIVLDVNRAEVKLAIPTPLVPGSKAEVRLDSGGVVAGNVRYCRQLGETEFHIGLQRAGADDVADRRKEPRYATTGRALLRYPGETGDEECHATIYDVSKGGLGLSGQSPIAAGTVVELTFDGSTVTGVVRNCRPHEGGFRIGIALTHLEVRSQSRTEREPVRQSLERSRAWFGKTLRALTPRAS